MTDHSRFGLPLKDEPSSPVVEQQDTPPALVEDFEGIEEVDSANQEFNPESAQTVWEPVNQEVEDTEHQDVPAEDDKKSFSIRRVAIPTIVLITVGGVGSYFMFLN